MDLKPRQIAKQLRLDKVLVQGVVDKFKRGAKKLASKVADAKVRSLEQGSEHAVEIEEVIGSMAWNRMRKSGSKKLQSN